jgi:hypothetical protein
VGAAFLLVLIVVVVLVVGVFVYAIAARLRKRQLDPRGDRTEGPTRPRDGDRPEHVRVGREQRSRFVGTRR